MQYSGGIGGNNVAEFVLIAALKLNLIQRIE